MSLSHSQAWYVSRSGRAEGPFATEYVRALLTEGHLSGLDLVYREGDDQWLPAAHFKALSKTGVSTEEKKMRGPREADQGGEVAGSTPLVSWIVLKPHGGTYLQDGPYSTKQVIDGLRKGRFQYTQYIWRPGIEKWRRIGDLAEFDRRSDASDLVLPIPPPLPDPVAAVILEDDGDEQAEEFHISIPEITGEYQLGSFGDEASPEAGPDKAVQVDLASVPWEQGASPKNWTNGPPKSEPPRPQNEPPQNHRKEQSEPQSNELQPAQVNVESSRSVGFGVVPSRSLKVRGVGTTAIKGFVAASAGVACALALHFYLRSEFDGVFQAGTEAINAKTADASGQSDSSSDSQIGASEKESANAAIKGSSEAIVQQDPFFLQTEFGTESILKVELKRNSGYRVQKLIFSGKALQNPSLLALEVDFLARSGRAVDRMQVRKNLSIALGQKKGSGQIERTAELDLTPLSSHGLVDGFYQVTTRSKSGEGLERDLSFELYLGDDPQSSLAQIDEFLMQNSAEIQSQKRTLFYAARDLDQLARELARIYGQNRKNQAQWTAGTTEWLKSLEGIKQALKTLKAKPQDSQAFPDEVDSVILFTKSLEVVYDEFSEAVKQSRDLASDRLSDLISALGAEKIQVGALRVTIPTGDADEGGSL